MNHEEIYKKLCEWSPKYITEVRTWKPWGQHSIVIWLNNGMIYKAKLRDNMFIIQQVSTDDIIRKFGFNN